MDDPQLNLALSQLFWPNFNLCSEFKRLYVYDEAIPEPSSQNAPFYSPERRKPLLDGIRSLTQIARSEYMVTSEMELDTSTPNLTPILSDPISIPTSRSVYFLFLIDFIVCFRLCPMGLFRGLGRAPLNPRLT